MAKSQSKVSSSSSGKEEQEGGGWLEGAAAEFDFVRFTVSDINGVPRSKLIPRRHVDDKLATGIGMCAGQLLHPLLSVIYLHVAVV